ncbi:MAG: FG-GAP-like repeat-containing protein [Polyangia bacterium]
MKRQLLALLWTLALPGCHDLWGSLSGDNPLNCVVTPGICAANESCDPALERCLRVQDGGTAAEVVCPVMPCPAGQSCDVAAMRCVASPSTLDVTAVRPRTGPLTGVSMAVIEGSGFKEPASVLFGNLAAPAVSVLGPERLAVQIPAAAQPGLVSVKVSLDSGTRVSVTKERLFGYAWSRPGFTTDPSLDPQGQTAGPLILTDLNGDKRLDVAVAHGSRISAFLGSGSGLGSAITTAGNGTMGAASGRFAAARINQDAFTDLALLDPTAGNVIVLLSDGTGHFSVPIVTAVGTSTRDLALADVDGDQRPDLLVLQDAPDQLVIYGGLGDGTFRTPALATIGEGRGPCSLAVGLFDADSRPDVAVVLCQAAEVRVRTNIGGTLLFGPPRSYFTQAGRATPRWIAAADMNADSRVDLIVSNSDQSTTGSFSVLLGQGTGEFATALTAATDTATQEVFQVGDLDGDGFPDVIAAPSTGPIDAIRFLLGDGFGGLRSPQKVTVSGTTPNGLRVLAVGDVTGDDKPDILFTSAAPSVALLRNVSQ